MAVDMNLLEKAVKDVAVDGRLACGVARSLAEQYEVPYREIGDIANKLDLKISSCELGCF